MPKAAPDAMIDASLDYVAGSDTLYICSAEPADFAGIAAVALADVAIDAGDFTKADAAGGGRQLTVGAQNGVVIDTSGTGNHIAVANAAGSTLRYVTTFTAQALTAGNQANVGSFVVTVGDPQ